MTTIIEAAKKLRSVLRYPSGYVRIEEGEVLESVDALLALILPEDLDAIAAAGTQPPESPQAAYDRVMKAYEEGGTFEAKLHLHTQAVGRNAVGTLTPAKSAGSPWAPAVGDRVRHRSGRIGTVASIDVEDGKPWCVNLWWDGDDDRHLFHLAPTSLTPERTLASLIGSMARDHAAYFDKNPPPLPPKVLTDAEWLALDPPAPYAGDPIAGAAFMERLRVKAVEMGRHVASPDGCIVVGPEEPVVIGDDLWPMQIMGHPTGSLRAVFTSSAERTATATVQRLVEGKWVDTGDTLPVSIIAPDIVAPTPAEVVEHRGTISPDGDSWSVTSRVVQHDHGIDERCGSGCPASPDGPGAEPEETDAARQERARRDAWPRIPPRFDPGAALAWARKFDAEAPQIVQPEQNLWTAARVLIASNSVTGFDRLFTASWDDGSPIDEKSWNEMLANVNRHNNGPGTIPADLRSALDQLVIAQDTINTGRRPGYGYAYRKFKSSPVTAAGCDGDHPDPPCGAAACWRDDPLAQPLTLAEAFTFANANDRRRYLLHVEWQEENKWFQIRPSIEGESEEVSVRQWYSDGKGGGSWHRRWNMPGYALRFRARVVRFDVADLDPASRGPLR